jgi:formylglycine-generating enzyme required for sulfatase activity
MWVVKKITGFLLLASLFFGLAIPSHPFAATRGIKVTVKTPEGEKIDLYRDSYALVIGNGNYKRGWDPLPGAIRDAKDVAAALTKNGFEVTLKTDLTRDAFNRALGEFVLRYGKGKDNRLLFYYAGHGHTQQMATGEELGYLVMIDAPAPEKDPLGFSLASVDMQTVITQAKMIRSKHVLFMFDSCFSGTVLNLRDRVTPRVISDKVRYPVRQFITAGRANEPVPDRSVFKEAFLDILEGRDREPIPDGYLTGEELGLYLKNKVPEYNPMQHPQYGKIRDPRLDKGDFIFMLAKSGAGVIERPGKKATLRIKANVSGARVGPAPITIDDIQPGNYGVKVAKEGYEPYEERISISPGKVLEVRVSLERVVTTGSISLSGSPEGAKVYLDGYYSGRLPCTIEHVEPGRHTLKVKIAGYQDWEEKVRVVAGEIQRLEVKLGKKLTQPARPEPVAKRFTNSVDMEFVLIPAGKFKMGSPRGEQDRDEDERQHKVTISRPFYMQTTEVTQAQWEAVMGDNPSYFEECGDDCPVERVSWDDCQEFIRRLNSMEGTDTYRLPTEAEWEYACRAGSSTRYCFGDSEGKLAEYAWYIDNSEERSHRVGQKKPNAWGLYDMHGNVWEWCQDWYGRYPLLRTTNPKGPFRGLNRVNRGGSWDDPTANCRSASRDDLHPEWPVKDLGFRLVRDLD